MNTTAFQEVRVDAETMFGPCTMHFDPNTSTLSQVSMRYDGRIPDHMMRTTEKIDAERRLNIARVRVCTLITKRDTAIVLMVQAIEEAGARRESVACDDWTRQTCRSRVCYTQPGDRLYVIACGKLCSWAPVTRVAPV